MKVGLGKNFVRNKEVEQGRHLVKSMQGLGMVGCWATLGAGVPLNGKGVQTQPLLHPAGTGKPCLARVVLDKSLRVAFWRF